MARVSVVNVPSLSLCVDVEPKLLVRAAVDSSITSDVAVAVVSDVELSVIGLAESKVSVGVESNEDVEVMSVDSESNAVDTEVEVKTGSSLVVEINEAKPEMVVADSFVEFEVNVGSF